MSLQFIDWHRHLFILICVHSSNPFFSAFLRWDNFQLQIRIYSFSQSDLKNQSTKMTSILDTFIKPSIKFDNATISLTNIRGIFPNVIVTFNLEMCSIFCYSILSMRKQKIYLSTTLHIILFSCEFKLHGTSRIFLLSVHTSFYWLIFFSDVAMGLLWGRLVNRLDKASCAKEVFG